MRGSNMIYIPAKKKAVCKECKGKAFYVLEKYEYICQDCDGIGYRIIDVNIDIETLKTMIKEN
tara:strand:- start:222 stop:410 length:189 start_codon:yes stop_codon:yes gene_type:complete